LAEESHHVLDLERPPHLLQAGHLHVSTHRRPWLPPITARHNWAGRILLPQEGDRLKQAVDALERLHPADEQDHALVLRDPGELARLVFRDRVEMSGIDARRDDLHAAGVDVIEPLELRQFGLRGGDDPVGLTQQPTLGLQAHPRVGWLRLRRDAVLHRRQGVEHLDQRDAPARAQLEPGQAREPVVTVQYVVPDPFRLGEAFDVRDERRQVIQQPVPRQRRLGSGRDMDDPVAMAQIVEHMRDVLVLRTSEDIRSNAAPAQLARQVADVDIHPTRIFAAQRRQRAGVVGDHGDAHLVIIHRAGPAAKDR
jgi:hypothetical protein